MKPIYIKFLPYLIIILGLFLLYKMNQPVPAGICILLGVVMIIERIWPEEWGKDKKEI